MSRCSSHLTFKSPWIFSLIFIKLFQILMNKYSNYIFKSIYFRCNLWTKNPTSLKESQRISLLQKEVTLKLPKCKTMWKVLKNKNPQNVFIDLDRIIRGSSYCVEVNGRHGTQWWSKHLRKKVGREEGRVKLKFQICLKLKLGPGRNKIFCWHQQNKYFFWEVSPFPRIHLRSRCRYRLKRINIRW